MLAVVLLSGGAAPVQAMAQDMPATRSATVHPYAIHVADAARRFGIPETWIWAVIRVESGGNSRAVSRAGAMGLMQIMPATWAGLRTRYGLGTDPFDVRDNIMAGTAYLRAMHDRYGNASAMLAAYNAGPGRYDDYLSRGRPLPPETVGYLARLAPITRTSNAVEVGGCYAAPARSPGVAPRCSSAWRVPIRMLSACRSGAPKPQLNRCPIALHPAMCVPPIHPPMHGPTRYSFPVPAGAGRNDRSFAPIICPKQHNGWEGRKRQE